jgi:hypothetical protein
MSNLRLGFKNLVSSPVPLNVLRIQLCLSFSFAVYYSGSCGDWMELAQDRDGWRVLVSTVRKLRLPKMRGIS